MPALQELMINTNALSGPLPDAWGRERLVSPAEQRELGAALGFPGMPCFEFHLHGHHALCREEWYDVARSTDRLGAHAQTRCEHVRWCCHCENAQHWKASLSLLDEGVVWRDLENSRK